MALLVVLMALGLVGVVVAGVALSSSTDAMIAGNVVRSEQARAAADAALEWSVDELSGADWDAALMGALHSAFVDGPPAGIRLLADGTSLTLDEIVNLANCDQRAPCSPGNLSAVTVSRPWGANNPIWQLYAYGPLSLLTRNADDPPIYLVVLLADDPSENDGNPLADGVDPSNRGAGRLMLQAEAFGTRGARSLIAATIERVSPSTVRTLSWRWAE
jgi:hypothetical protein